jgi:hypothetical protein
VFFAGITCGFYGYALLSVFLAIDGSANAFLSFSSEAWIVDLRFFSYF